MNRPEICLQICCLFMFFNICIAVHSAFVFQSGFADAPYNCFPFYTPDYAIRNKFPDKNKSYIPGLLTKGHLHITHSG